MAFTEGFDLAIWIGDARAALNSFAANTGMPNGGAARVNGNPGGPNPGYTFTAKSFEVQPGVSVFGNAGPVPPYAGFGISQNFRRRHVQNALLRDDRRVAHSEALLLYLWKPAISQGYGLWPWNYVPQSAAESEVLNGPQGVSVCAPIQAFTRKVDRELGAFGRRL